MNEGERRLAIKRQMAECLERHARLAGARVDAFCAAFYAPGVRWFGPHPVNAREGRAAVAEGFWRPLLAAFPDLERRLDLLLHGGFRAGDWIAAMGHFAGTFSAPLFGIPPTGRAAFLRYGEFSRIENGQVVECYMIVDLPGLMHQAGCLPLPKSLGVEILIPGPATRDGVSLAAAPAEETQASLALVEAMIAGLMRYDGKTLASMEQNLFWRPDFLWYGPTGIGTARGLSGFQNHHQIPFLKAFPDRVGGDHKCRIGDGAYVASTGWPSVRATHLGGGWLGCPPTGKRIGMRVMDFWRREGDRLAENWVFIDLLDLLLQMDVDLLERMHEIR